MLQGVLAPRIVTATTAALERLPLRALLCSLRLAQDTTGAEGGLYAQVTFLAG